MVGFFQISAPFIFVVQMFYSIKSYWVVSPLEVSLLRLGSNLFAIFMVSFQINLLTYFLLLNHNNV